jgi:hypothetical protein
MGIGGVAFDALSGRGVGASSRSGPPPEILKPMPRISFVKSTVVAIKSNGSSRREGGAMSPDTGVVQERHEFSLLYTGVDDLTDELSDALFEAGCDDATIGIQNGFFFADFHRQAATFREALISAIEDVERSGQPLRLVRVEPLD